jgi:hypothetical protein
MLTVPAPATELAPRHTIRERKRRIPCRPDFAVADFVAVADWP